MSRVGKNPVPLPKGVEATLAADQITVKGPLGTLNLRLHPDVTVARDGETLFATEGPVSKEGREKLIRLLKSQVEGS